MDARQWPNVQSLTVLTKRKHEPHMETELIDPTGRWCLNPSQPRLSRLLASLRRFAIFDWTGFSNLKGLSTSNDRCVAQSRSGSNRVQSKTTQWLRSFPTGNACCRCCPARQVCVGIKTHHVQRIRAPCYRFIVERAAARREPPSEVAMCPGCEQKEVR